MNLEETLDHLPTGPGCYLFYGTQVAKRVLLYVGKAKNLRSRVRSYFAASSSDNRTFIPLLRAQVTAIESVVTSTEKEAAILENSLIKEHQPRFNSKLRDDKEFLLLRLDEHQTWPRVTIIRKPTQDRAKYFGPFHTATHARRSLHLVNKHFQLRTCNDTEFKSRQRPCLQHQIKRCPAPCVFEVDRDFYKGQVRAVTLFLSGRHDQLTREVERKMKKAATSLDFELAAIHRDQLAAIAAMRDEQRVVLTGTLANETQDVIGLYRQGDLAEFVVLYLREGRVTNSVAYSYSHNQQPDDELVATFLRDHYDFHPLPDHIVVPALPEAFEGLAELWEDKIAEAGGTRRKVKMSAPSKGHLQPLLEMAAENAKHAFEQKLRAREGIDIRLQELADRLRLERLPRHIECCDISHLGGQDTVGSIVALIDGEPAPARYKWFHVRTAGEGDDYAAMFEVLSRRFRRGAEDDDSTWELPDLFIVDGGRAQLAIALMVAADLGLGDLPIVGLAKERTERNVIERVFLPNQKNPIPIEEYTSAMVFLMRARDEAHRFANWAREKVGTKARLHSAMDDIKGVGAKTRKALLEAFGSLEAVGQASDEAILAVAGVTARHLKALRAPKKTS